MYPTWKYRALEEGESVGKNGELYVGVIVHSEEQDKALGEKYVDDLKDIPAVFEKYHKPDMEAGEQVSVAPISEVVEEAIHEMTEAQIRKILVERHGYNTKKLAKKTKDQLLAIFSS